MKRIYLFGGIVMNKNYFGLKKESETERAFRLYDEGINETNMKRCTELLTEAAKLLGFDNIKEMIIFLHNDLEDDVF